MSTLRTRAKAAFSSLLPRRVRSFLKTLCSVLRDGDFRFHVLEDTLQTLTRRLEEEQTRTAHTRRELSRLKSSVILNDTKVNLALYSLPKSNDSAYTLVENPLLITSSELLDPFEHQVRLRGSHDTLVSRYNERVAHMFNHELAKNIAPTRYLDLGCGNGMVTSIFANHFSSITEVCGVDFVECGFTATVKKSCHNVHNVTFRETGVMTDLLLRPKNTYSLISMIHAFEHLAPSEQTVVFSHLTEVLVPGGVCYLEMPNVLNWFVLRDFFWADPQHLRPYSITLITTILEALGNEYVWGVYDSANHPVASKDFLKDAFHADFQHMDLFVLFKKGSPEWALIENDPES